MTMEDSEDKKVTKQKKWSRRTVRIKMSQQIQYFEVQSNIIIIIIMACAIKERNALKNTVQSRMPAGSSFQHNNNQPSKQKQF
jgi:hypothetical protein